MLDRYSIASRSIEVTLLWTPLDSFIWRELKLDTSQSIELCVFYIYIYLRDFFLSHFIQSLLTEKRPSLFQTPLTHTLHLPYSFFGLKSDFSLLYDLLSYIYHAFHLFWPNFWGFWKILGLSKLMKFLWNFWDKFCLNDLKCSCIALLLHFNNVSCIIDVCSICWNDVCW